MRLLPAFACAARTLLCIACLGCSTAGTQPASSTPRSPWQVGGTPGDEASLGADLELFLDRGVDPCDDFAAYACGGWHQLYGGAAEAPPVGLSARWAQLIVELVSELEAPPSTADAQARSAADFYRSCMDEAAIGRRAARDLGVLLRPLDNAQTLDALFLAMGKLWALPGFAPLGGPSAGLSMAGPLQGVAYLGSADLDLPATAWLDPDTRLADAHQRYLQRLFTLGGGKPGEAALARQAYSALAAILTPPKAEPDPADRERPVELEQFLRDTGLPWRRMFEGSGLSAPQQLHVLDPEFHRRLGPVLERLGIEVLRSYLRASVLTALARHLGGAFASAGNDLNAAATGSRADYPRQLICAQSTATFMSDAVAKLHRDRQGVAATLDAVGPLGEELRAQLAAVVGAWPWPTAEDRAFALQKVAAVQILHRRAEAPAAHAASATPTATAYVTRLMQLADRSMKQRWAQVGSPASMADQVPTFTMIEAAYAARINAILFADGLVGPPLAYEGMPRTLLLSGLGMVLAHELAHATGRSAMRYDLQSEIGDHLSPAALAWQANEARCLAQQIPKQLQAIGGAADPARFVEELRADALALDVAFAANRRVRERHSPLPGLTPDELFFVSYAQRWCDAPTALSARYERLTDSHLLGPERVNSALRLSDSFRSTYRCGERTRMVAFTRCPADAQVPQVPPAVPGTIPGPAQHESE